jgi:hypothetical protein
MSVAGSLFYGRDAFICPDCVDRFYRALSHHRRQQAQTESPVASESGFAELARKAFMLAQEEAHRFNHNYIGTEHLLLGLIREGEGIATGVLESLGVNLEQVRSETLKVLETR